MSRSVVVAALMALGLFAPSLAEAADQLSTSDRLDDRRFVTIGPRAYELGTEAGRYPAAGFHTRGEMGGVWTPPIKLVDGIWFGVGDEWIGPASRFTSGWGHVKMRLPRTGGLRVERTDFVPGERRGVLVGLKLSGKSHQTVDLRMQTHSELMSIYPWGETTPSQTDFNQPDSVAFQGRELVFGESGTPPVTNAIPHDWGAAVGSALTPTGHQTGDGFRGPQEPVEEDELSGPSGPNTPPTPDRCDDTAYGKGKGGELTYEVKLPRSGETTVWFGVAGSESGTSGARAELRKLLDEPGRALRAKLREREALSQHTKLELPGDRLLARGIEWSKQNLADSVQEARDLELREVNAGKNYPAPKATMAQGALRRRGLPRLPVAVRHRRRVHRLRVRRARPVRADQGAHAGAQGGVGQAQRQLRQGRPRGGHRRLGLLRRQRRRGQHRRDGQVPERGRADLALDGRRRLPRRDVRVREVEPASTSTASSTGRRRLAGGPRQRRAARHGRGEARQHDGHHARPARPRGPRQVQGRHARPRRGRATRPPTSSRASSSAWWMDKIPQHADSLDDPGNVQVQQRHWIGVTPMEIETVRDGEVVPGLTTSDHGNRALNLRETPCYGDDFGLFHTGDAGCDPAESTVPAEKSTFTLNTSIMAVGEGNYGRLGKNQQQRFTTANRRVQLPDPDEQPGAMPEIVPSPGYQPPQLDRKFTERAMVLQAWGNYGTAWPVVHQQLGVRPDAGRHALEVVPQVPEGQPSVAGSSDPPRRRRRRGRGLAHRQDTARA